MVFCRRTESFSRPTNGRRIILASFPVLHNRRFAMLPFALKGYLPPSQVPFGVLDLGNGCCHLSVELSRAVSSNAGSATTSQSPELGDLLQNRFPYAAARWAAACLALLLRSGSYTSPLTHKRCSKIPNFRATATIARFFAFLPPRWASFNPQRRRSVSGPWRPSM